MNKGKNLWKMFAIMLLVAVLSVSVTSCGDDDDDIGIVGTWAVSKSDGMYAKILFLNFEEDGTGTYVERYHINATETYDDTTPFFFTKKNNSKGHIVASNDEKIAFHYEIMSRVLILYESRYDNGTYHDSSEIVHTFTKK